VHEKHDRILLDDPQLQEMETQQLVPLLESDHEVYSRILRKCITKKAGIVQLITIKYDALQKLNKFARKKQFLRRIRVMPVDTDLISNINLHVHYHSYIYNNERVIKLYKQILDKIKRTQHSDAIKRA
jgi:hypothetical protein